MSLRLKIIRTLLVLVALYAAADHGVQRMILTPSFEDLEHEHAERDLKRTVVAIENEVQNLNRLAAGLASNPALDDYIARSDDTYERVLLHEGTLDAQRVDLLFVIDSEGGVLWSDIRPEAPGMEGRLRGFPRGRLAASHPLLASARGDLEPISGLMSTERGPMVVSSRPVLEPGHSKLLGRLLMGSLLPGARMEAIGTSTGLQLDVWALDSPELPPEMLAIRDDVTAAAGTVLRAIDNDHLEAFATLDDIQHRPAMLLRAKLPRTISARGRNAIQYALLSAVAIGLGTLLVLQRLLGRMVLEPLATLTQHAVAIGKSDDAHARVGMERDDEIGTLAREFDSMLEKLAASREAVVTAARSAGMSEIATGILHNVGNVLNSVVLGVELADDRLRRSKLPQLSKLVVLLESQGDQLATFIADDPRGQKLLPFLQALVRELESERSNVAGELVNVREGVDHIRELVASQQAYAGQSRLDESLDLGQQIDKAVELTAQASGAVARDLEIVRDYDDLPIVSVDRHKLLEILVNLIQNARQSVAEAGVDAPRLTVSVKTTDSGTLRLAVRDNGLGIAPDHVERIFSHGFTTKKNGHGFGLHSAANSATELGGHLSVTSDGLGCGAEFVLEFPLQRAKAA
ncbi:ATP-binding protein [Engelhardtia mirabilis]|uniref:histidine kinase n=1 Tax=Engelhardtia mirabilis TaxID=2528011 RepID=A0A518BEV3_9BACT|nr:Sensor protein ZraS [Planctomycetes bacterium Pla133]QDU99841.1 Sensor protein ZraS [Planctomycetes bacterium Pla86]